MALIKVDKLYKGQYVSVRDYIVKEHIKKRQALRIKHSNKIMTIPFSKLKDGITNKELFKSKYSGTYYRLIDYLWKPDNKDQMKLI